MVVGKDGSSMFFSVDQNKIPYELYLKPDKDRDDGYTLLFKEDGLLDMMITNGHIFYFSNFNGYTYDVAIIYPDGTKEYRYDIQTDVNWAAYEGRSIRSGRSGQGRALFDGELDFGDFEFALGMVSDAVGIASCVSAVVLQVTWVGCALYILPKVGSLILKYSPERPGDSISNDTSSKLFDALFNAVTVLVERMCLIVFHS